MMGARAQSIGDDIIVALATPWGHAALALLRLSGPQVGELGRRLCPEGPQWRPRRASHRMAIGEDGAVIDDLVATWMPGPHTATGEDVLELSCHGNPIVVERLLDRCVALGARPARPGEFSRRALTHGRLDLMGAEALHGLISARSTAGVVAARRAMDGGLQNTLSGLRERMLDLTAELEVRLDHPGEDLGEASDEDVHGGLVQVADELGQLAQTWRAGKVRLEGAKVALVGAVNAGKSSLFNGLVGSARALVSSEPGTTRDVVEKAVLMDGLEVLFLDTAGERSASGLEAAGQQLGRTLTQDVDLRLHVFSALAPPAAEVVADMAPGWLVATHVDQAPVPTELHGRPVRHGISNVTGEGVEALRKDVRAALGRGPIGGAAMVVSQRQHELLVTMSGQCAEAADALVGFAGPAVAAECMTLALERLGELTGADVREDILDRLFARFCIGK